MKEKSKNTPDSILRFMLRIIVHIMATILLINGVMGLFLTEAYSQGIISPEDQSHLRVFWAVPIIASLGIHYGLYSLYAKVNNRDRYVTLLRGIAIWMAIAAAVRLISIIALGDPTPRIAIIIVEAAFVPLLYFLSSLSKK